MKIRLDQILFRICFMQNDVWKRLFNACTRFYLFSQVYLRTCLFCLSYLAQSVHNLTNLVEIAVTTTLSLPLKVSRLSPCRCVCIRLRGQLSRIIGLNPLQFVIYIAYSSVLILWFKSINISVYIIIGHLFVNPNIASLVLKVFHIIYVRKKHLNLF